MAASYYFRQIMENRKIKQKQFCMFDFETWIMA